MKNKLIGISGRIGSGKDTLGTIFQYLEYRKTFKVTIPISEKNFNIFVNSLAHIDQIWKIKKFADKLKDMVCLLIGCTRDQLEDREFKEKELGEEWTKYRIITKGLPNYYVSTLQEAEDNVRHSNQRYVKVVMTPRLMLQLLGTECGRNIIHPQIWVNALFADYKVSKRDFKDGNYIGGSCVDCGKLIGVSCAKRQPWCLTCSKKEDKPNWIITDVRFPNEAQAIKDRCGVVIRIERNKNKHFISEGTKPKGLVKVIRKLDNGEEIEWTCFWDYNSWYDSSGVNIPNVLKWEDKIVEHPSETALDNHNFDYVIDNNGSVSDLIDKVKQLKLV